jgi:hypothetical protein
VEEKKHFLLLGRNIIIPEMFDFLYIHTNNIKVLHYIYKMISHIIRLITKNKNKNNNIFDIKYRNGYRKSWIQNIRDYYP